VAAKRTLCAAEVTRHRHAAGQAAPGRYPAVRHVIVFGCVCVCVCVCVYHDMRASASLMCVSALAGAYGLQLNIHAEPSRAATPSQHITHHTSHVTHHTSHITHHTSHITHHITHVTTQRAGDANSRLRCFWNIIEYKSWNHPYLRKPEHSGSLAHLRAHELMPRLAHAPARRNLAKAARHLDTLTLECLPGLPTTDVRGGMKMCTRMDACESVLLGSVTASVSANVALPPLRKGAPLQEACVRHPCRGRKQEEAIVETRYASPADQSALPQLGTHRRDLQIRQVVNLTGCYSCLRSSESE